MNSYSPFRIFAYSDKIVQDSIIGNSPIDKVQILMVKPSLSEFCGVVSFFIKTNDSGDFVPSKIGKVRFGRVHRISKAGNPGSVLWSAKSDEFLWNYPIEISVFHTLVVLILQKVEIVEVKVAKVMGFFDGFETIQ